MSGNSFETPVKAKLASLLGYLGKHQHWIIVPLVTTRGEKTLSIHCGRRRYGVAVTQKKSFAYSVLSVSILSLHVARQLQPAPQVSVRQRGSQWFRSWNPFKAQKQKTVLQNKGTAGLHPLVSKATRNGPDI